MDKEPDVDIINLADKIIKESKLDGNNFGKKNNDNPLFSKLQGKTLFIAGAVVLFIIIVFLLSRLVYISKADFNALIKRVDRIEARLGDMKGSTKYHVVARGESLSLIADKYGLTVDGLCKLNKITPRQTIYPGQKLLVPAAKSP